MYLGFVSFVACKLSQKPLNLCVFVGFALITSKTVIDLILTFQKEKGQQVECWIFTNIEIFRQYLWI